VIGIVNDAPDQESAIKKAIEELKVPENLRDRLVAQRRDEVSRSESGLWLCRLLPRQCFQLAMIVARAICPPSWT
jgi:hypothetical protein